MSDTVAVLSIDIKGRDVGVAEMLAALEKKARQADRALDQVAGGAQQAAARFRPLTAAEQKAEAAALRLAQAAARVDTALAQQAAATSRAASAAAGAAAAQDRAAVAALRRAQAEQRAAAASQQGAAAAGSLRGSLGQLAGAAGQVQAALGAAGFALGAQQVLQFSAAAVQAANSLEKTQALVRVLAGDQATYNQIVALATEQQERFGGSVEPILAALGRLTPLARNTGLAIDELNQALQLLALASPEQGIEGANLALREFLTGTGADAVLSLAERFELPRKALQELTAEGVTSQERLSGLFTLLQQQGFTMEALAAQTNTVAASYDRLGGSLSTLQAQIGSLLAQGFEPAVVGLDRAASGLSEFLTLVTGGTTQFQAQAEALAAAGVGYEEYRARAEAAVGSALNFILGNEILVSALNALAPGLVHSATEFARMASEAQILSEAEYEAAAAADTATAATLDSASASDQAAAAANSETIATYGAAEASGAAALSAGELAAQRLLQAAQAQESEAAELLLADAIREANAAGADVGPIVARVVQALGIEEGQVYQLIGAYRALQTARAGGAASGALDVLGAGVGAGGVGGGKGNRSVLSQFRLNLANQQEAELRRQLERQAAQAQAAATRAAASAGRGGGGGGRRGQGGRSAANTQAEKDAEKRAQIEEDLNERLADINEAYYEKAAAAEERYQERILKINAEYQERLLEDQRDFQAESIGSKADFYDQLTQADIPPNVAADISAQYEAAYAEAQRLSQEGKADQAADYLALKQEQLRAELEYQAAVAKAREEGDQNEIKRLEAIKRLRDQEFEARLSNLDARGDQNVNARDEALADAETQRQEDLADAATAAGKAIGDAQEAAAEKAAKLNKELQTQVDLLNRSAGLGGPAVGPGAPATTPTATPTVPAGTAAPAATPSSGLPGGGGDGSTEVTSQQIVTAILNLGTRIDRLTTQVAQVGRRSTVQPSGG